MPYIKSNDGRREALQRGEPAQNAGELNYQIFHYIKLTYYINSELAFREQIFYYIYNFLGEKPTYQRYNDITGVMIRCYKELKRRLDIDVKDLFIEIMESYDRDVDIYEDKKILENGDVE